MNSDADAGKAIRRTCVSVRMYVYLSTYREREREKKKKRQKHVHGTCTHTHIRICISTCTCLCHTSMYVFACDRVQTGVPGYINMHATSLVPAGTIVEM